MDDVELAEMQADYRAAVERSLSLEKYGAEKHNEVVRLRAVLKRIAERDCAGICDADHEGILFARWAADALEGK